MYSKKAPPRTPKIAIRFPPSAELTELIISMGVETLGAGVEEWEDGFAVIGKRTLPGGGIIDCACDHRIAMSAGIAAARCENSITLLGSECVAKSYPGFWEDFASLGGKWTCK